MNPPFACPYKEIPYMTSQEKPITELVGNLEKGSESSMVKRSE